ncbi:hypothetical protein GCM10010975_26770 [Comamonas phosphati]|nr:hypothetical protein GCM10010975_26770 [Comamonas phosphati]
MNEHAIAGAMGQRSLTKASQVLTGIVTGIVADGQLHDMEIQMLSGWLTAHQEVTQNWPGSAIAKLVQQVMADGVITEEERAHLVAELQAMVGNDFAETGSVSDEIIQLPFDDTTSRLAIGSRVCLTGTFVYGTRNACERLAIQAGLEPSSSVSKKVHALIVGTHISPDWVNTSYGTKIIRAMELREEGHAILIVRERDWLNSLS